MPEKKNMLKGMLKRAACLCLAAALALPPAPAAYGAAEGKNPEAHLSGGFLEDGSYRVSCSADFGSISPSAEIKYLWVYKKAGDQTSRMAATSEGFLDFAPGEISGEASCTCTAEASWKTSFSLVNDAYLRFLHRPAEAGGYENWKGQLLAHTSAEYAKKIDACISPGAVTDPREISGIACQVVFSDEYLGAWDPEGKGYVRQNPVPYAVNGARTKNTPEQLIYDCFLYLRGKEPSEAEVQDYLNTYYIPYKDQGASYGLAGGAYPINAGMTCVINTLAEQTECDEHLETTYEQYDTYGHKFTYTEDDITVKEKKVQAQAREEFTLPAEFTLNYYLQAEGGGWEKKETLHRYSPAGSLILCQNYRKAFPGWEYSHAESGGGKVLSAEVAADNSTAVNYYYKKKEQAASYTVIHYKQDTAGTSYEAAETEKLSGTAGTKLQMLKLAHSYSGFSFRGGKTVPAAAPRISAPVSGFVEEAGAAQGAVIALFYDRNSYKVSLSKGDGIKSVSGAGSYRYGESVRVSAEAAEGYKFKRWDDPDRGVNGTSRSHYNKDLGFTMPANDVVLAASGEEEGGLEHLLTVFPGEGEWQGSSMAGQIDMKPGESIEIEDPVLPGGIFTGWVLLYGDGDFDAEEKTFTMKDEDSALLATWILPEEEEPSYTVNHYRRELDGSWALYESETQEAEAGTLVTPDVKEYEGFTAPAPRTASVGSAGETEVNYYYERNRYAVRFDGSGADRGETPGMELKYGEGKPLPENGFIRFGYEFEGWSRNPDGSGEILADGAEVINLSTTQGAEVTLYAVWYDLPFITAPDRYFSLDEAQAGKITEEELLAKASIDGPAGGLHVKDYDAAFWTAQDEEKEILVTYAAEDSKGRPISAKATVYLADTAPEYDLHMPYARFISPKYWRYEDGERAGELADPEDGGVEWWSVWRNNPEYTAAMDFQMELSKSIKWGTASMKAYGQTITVQTEKMTDCNQIQYSYYFTHEDVLKVKEYVAEHGLGNALEPGSLRRFMDQFEHCRKREREYLYDPVNKRRVRKI